MTEYISTPISWGSEFLDNFIPVEYEKQVKFLNPPEFSKKKLYEGTIEVGLEKVLQNPIGYDVSFDDLVKEKYEKGKPIIFAVDDYTRPNIHTKIILPIMIKKLLSLGVDKTDIQVLIACGTHRVPKEGEYEKILGDELFEELKSQVTPHDCDNDTIMIGESDVGTPMGFNKMIFDSSLLIPVTDSELHYFAGVAGTVKEICPGIASRKTVSRNHPKMFDKDRGFADGCRLGNADETNLVITDIKNMVSILKKQVTIFGIDTIVTDGEIVYVNAGDLIALHEAGRDNIIPMRTVKVSKAGDLVIMGLQSWGINLYQAGKGVHASWNAVRKDGNGEILVVAPCPDGVGNANYEKTMTESKEMSIQGALEYVLENYCSELTFKIGNQKPVDLLRMLKTVGEGNIKIISDMDNQELKDIYRMMPLKKPGDDTLEVLRKAVKSTLDKKPEAQVYIMDDPGLYIVVE